MNIQTGCDKTFLFLQGPHGPFFNLLGKFLTQTGAKVWRVGFNAGDHAFWRNRETYIAHTGPTKDWPDAFSGILDQRGVTDIVLYGDTRPVHAIAIAQAKQRGLKIHVFEEGYLRPYWVTYERDGSNGNSRLMALSVEQIRARRKATNHDVHEVPAHWGDIKHHMFYGALYHWFILFRNHRYPNYVSHRTVSVGHEFGLHIQRLVLLPWRALARVITTTRIKHGGFPYHVALLQLEHDASFQSHSDFKTMVDFLKVSIEGFAAGAPSHHHLVFKAHPLEDGRVPIQSDIRRLAHENGVGDRVHFVRGGKLAKLLDHAKSAIAINSTAAQQVLWRGLPLKALGAAVFAKPEFVSDLSIAEFFRNPGRSDVEAYRDYRLFLLETSQVAGGFYSTSGRRQLMRQLVDMMLHEADPYDVLQNGTAAPRQQLTIVK